MATKTIIVGGQYKVTHVISHAGSYGKVLGAVHKETLQPYAIKVGDNAKGTMANEIIIYNFLNKHVNTHFTTHGDNTIKINDIKSEKSGGWPTVHASGQDGKFTYIVMDIMGPALEQNLSAFIGQPMTVITAGLQMLQLIQKLHDKGVVHGDIKPGNILIQNITNIPYIIDFGLCGINNVSEGTGGTKPYCNPTTLNVYNDKEDSYEWTKNCKNNDLWSISLLFATIIIFRYCYNLYADYPSDFFDSEKYVTNKYIQRIPFQFREAFQLVLINPKQRVNNKQININTFIKLLESGLSYTNTIFDI